MHVYWTTNCAGCPLKPNARAARSGGSSAGSMRRRSTPCRQRLDRKTRRHAPPPSHVEHPFGTLKAWMGATHFKTRTLDKVRTEMSLHVLAYNLKRVIAILGAAPLMAAIAA